MERGLGDWAYMFIAERISSEIHFAKKFYKFHLHISHNVRLLRFHPAIPDDSQNVATMPHTDRTCESDSPGSAGHSYEMRFENSFKQMADCSLQNSHFKDARHSEI